MSGRLRKTVVPFAQVARTVAQTYTRSFLALGIYTYVQSLPDDWEISVARLAKTVGKREGYDAVNRAVKELIAVGLYHRCKVIGDDNLIKTYVVVTPYPCSIGDAATSVGISRSDLVLDKGQGIDQVGDGTVVKPQVAPGSRVSGTPGIGHPETPGSELRGATTEENLTERKELVDVEGSAPAAREALDDEVPPEVGVEPDAAAVAAGAVADKARATLAAIEASDSRMKTWRQDWRVEMILAISQRLEDGNTPETITTVVISSLRDGEIFCPPRILEQALSQLDEWRRQMDFSVLDGAPF